jgi:hypothetical protein
VVAVSTTPDADKPIPTQRVGRGGGVFFALFEKVVGYSNDSFLTYNRHCSGTIALVKMFGFYRLTCSLVVGGLQANYIQVIFSTASVLLAIIPAISRSQLKAAWK